MFGCDPYASHVELWLEQERHRCEVNQLWGWFCDGRRREVREFLRHPKVAGRSRRLAADLRKLLAQQRAQEQEHDGQVRAARELWDAVKCARILGFRNADAFKYQVHLGRFPAPVGFVGTAAQWDAQQVREVVAKAKG